jgi:hypothetical protein
MISDGSECPVALKRPYGSFDSWPHFTGSDFDGCLCQLRLSKPHRGHDQPGRGGRLTLDCLGQRPATASSPTRRAQSIA